jgi:DNA repair protein SbcC/Rad50
MRPTRLELAGFTAFREPVEIDFTDADLFALVGVTGAGKSAVLDAMVFALYGSVPRLGRRAVAPVISTGALEARVRFDFTYGGRDYTAVRVVRRTRAGATTREARLESGDEVLAGDADAVTAAVETLFGLGFEQFTTCVVLPQGEFARFLHATPADRQDLLVRLLELGVYERMRGAAAARRAAAEAQTELADRALERLAGATEEALRDAQARTARLEALRGEIDAAQPALDALAEQQRAAEAARDAAAAQADTLAGLAVPDDAAQLAAAAAAATERMAAAEARALAAEEAVTTADKIRSELGDPAPLQQARADHAQRSLLAARQANGEPFVAAAIAAETAARAALANAAAAVQAAEAVRERLRRDHAAHALAAHLVVCEPCPVCTQPVAGLPAHPPVPDLDSAGADLERARREEERARTVADEATEARITAEQTMASVREQLAEVTTRLAGAPDDAEAGARLAAIAAADAALAEAREQERELRAAARAAVQAVGGAAQRLRNAWSQFDAARDTLAALGSVGEPGPPLPAVDRDDLAAAWDDLAAWATAEAPRRAAAAAAATDRAQAARAAQQDQADALLARCADCDVEVPAGVRPRDATGEALARAEAAHDRIAADLEEAARLRAERDDHGQVATVAGALARHLSAAGFERWLLDEALDRLVAGASTVLRELSGGAYSLAVDDRHNFSVIDHRSADEQRPARTLSGGETFLASLALALALAEQLAELTAATAPRLDAIFLDEGFGSLDADTLDVVASAIEELGAAGRTVGLVTHVRDLADRVPVRFEVRRAPSGSTVERVGLGEVGA